MPLTKGVEGSSTCQACTTKSYRRRRALSARNCKRLILGGAQDDLKLLDLFVGEPAVIDCIILYLMH
jgi:hypothetical protein